MITRSHITEQSESTAVYSACERYRYALTRIWDPHGKRVLFIMLNPSKATEVQNDPTVERCERRARALGYGSFCVTNIFAWRETNPRLMKQADDPVGSENDAQIQQNMALADDVIAAWGTHGAHLGRGRTVQELLSRCGQPVFVLGLSKDGHPKHPLYIAYAQTPVLWSELSAKPLTI